MRRSGDRLVGVAGAVSAVALASVAWTGIMITRRYRPDGGAPGVLLPPSARWSRHLVHWHAVSLSLAVVAMVVWCGLMVASRGWRTRHATVAIASTIGTLAVLASSAVAWHRVRWGQLGLWAVTADPNVRGLWYAAFSEKVRFVYVDGSGDLSRSAVAPWVVVYLVAPFVALGLFAIGWMTTRPPRAARRTVVVAQTTTPAG